MNATDAKMETALITGASSGIGQHLAREFARHGHPVVLVAPIAAELDILASALRHEFGVMARPIARDLTKDGSPEEVFEETARQGIRVDILVNNAGFGQRGRFWENSAERDI